MDDLVYLIRRHGLALWGLSYDLRDRRQCNALEVDRVPVYPDDKSVGRPELRCNVRWELQHVLLCEFGNFHHPILSHK